MRLGQLARKYGISKKEIIAYLQEQDLSHQSLGQNTRLDPELVTLLDQRFADPDLLFEDQPTSASQKEEPQQSKEAVPIPEESIPAQDPEIDQGPAASEQTVTDTSEEAGKDPEQPQATSPVIPEGTIKNTEDRPPQVAIETDKLLELLESEENSPELDKITLIKASKRELEGLKVLGKIELPEVEPRKKGQKKERAEQDAKSKKTSGQQRKLTTEELEARRLKAKKKQQAYQARQEKRRKEKEKKRRKAINKARYQEKLKKAKVLKQKNKTKSVVEENTSSKHSPTTTPPKTLIGRLWRWLNDG